MYLQYTFVSHYVSVYPPSSFPLSLSVTYLPSPLPANGPPLTISTIEGRLPSLNEVLPRGVCVAAKKGEKEQT